MDERQMTICAGALYANDYRKDAIATALDISPERAQRLAEDAAAEQSQGRIGYMRSPSPTRE